MSPALAALLGCAALAGSAFGQVQSDFSMAAGREIWQVARFDPPRFALTLGSDASLFAFYGDGTNPLQGVKCERTAGFGFVALANDAGGILVGVCTREAQRVRALAVAAQPALASLLAQLSQAGTSLDRAALEKIGWTYVKNTGADGAEEHFFPVLAIGHGILGPQTLVRVPRAGRSWSRPRRGTCARTSACRLRLRSASTRARRSPTSPAGSRRVSRTRRFSAPARRCGKRSSRDRNR